MKRRYILHLAFLLPTLMLVTWQASYAHDARPLFLDIEQQDNVSYRMSLTVPFSVEVSNLPEILWPGNCITLNRSTTGNGTAYKLAGIIRCTGGLEGRTVGFTYPLYNPSLSTVIRYSPGKGQPRVTVLSPDKSSWTIPDRPRWWSVAQEYLKLGIEHILGGIDHLLFVTGLLILARNIRRVIIVITGFTIAHSITLSLAALKLINISTVPVEAAITLSILFLAAEITRNRKESLAYRYPLLVSSTFGLLHGFGFAAALKSIGLPREEITSALLCFNLGVELGQIAFILCITGIFRLVLEWKRLPYLLSWNVIRVTAGYVMGIPASYWLFNQLTQF